MNIHPVRRAGGGWSRTFRPQPMHGINVTPLVDVMLVLLIIFMITAPLLTSGVSVNLPSTEAGALPGDSEVLTITLDAEGGVFLGNTGVDNDVQLRERLNAIAAGDRDRLVYIRGDEALPYGAAMGVVAIVKNAGFARIGLVTAPNPVP